MIFNIGVRQSLRLNLYGRSGGMWNDTWPLACGMSLVVPICGNQWYTTRLASHLRAKPAPRFLLGLLDGVDFQTRIGRGNSASFHVIGGGVYSQNSAYQTYQTCDFNKQPHACRYIITVQYSVYENTYTTQATVYRTFASAVLSNGDMLRRRRRSSTAVPPSADDY